MTSTRFLHCRPEILLENIGGDKEAFLQLTEIFRRESASIFAQMQESSAKSDLSELGRQSHSLKGTVGPLGADHLVQMLLDIEDECASTQYICDEKRLALVEDELKAIGGELTCFVGRF